LLYAQIPFFPKFSSYQIGIGELHELQKLHLICCTTLQFGSSPLLTTKKAQGDDLQLKLAQNLACLCNINNAFTNQNA